MGKSIMIHFLGLVSVTVPLVLSSLCKHMNYPFDDDSPSITAVVVRIVIVISAYSFPVFFFGYWIQRNIWQNMPGKSGWTKLLYGFLTFLCIIALVVTLILCSFLVIVGFFPKRLMLGMAVNYTACVSLDIMPRPVYRIGIYKKIAGILAIIAIASGLATENYGQVTVVNTFAGAVIMALGSLIEELSPPENR